jgi:hypothetical protein
LHWDKWSLMQKHLRWSGYLQAGRAGPISGKKSRPTSFISITAASNSAILQRC